MGTCPIQGVSLASQTGLQGAATMGGRPPRSSGGVGLRSRVSGVPPLEFQSPEFDFGARVSGRRFPGSVIVLSDWFENRPRSVR
jgi:hypothetical protein